MCKETEMLKPMGCDIKIKDFVFIPVTEADIKDNESILNVLSNPNKPIEIPEIKFQFKLGDIMFKFNVNDY